MWMRERFSQTGLWLACGGLVILATHQLLAVYQPLPAGNVFPLLASAIAGYLITATGVVLCASGKPHRDSQPVERGPTSAQEVSSAAGNRSDPTRRMAADFLAWCEAGRHESNPWNSFDQLVRELLTEQLGVTRVRCFRVLPGDQQIRGLSQSGAPVDAKSARTGILGHVATTGQEFVASDPAQGELVHQLARDDEDAWEWICPIRESGLTIGLVAVGKFPAESRFDRGRRQELAVLITAFWKHVVCLERLQIAERTDKASGLLTRRDFFESASRALGESYAENEPVVVIALALEGLRRLDDVGRWSDRDTLVETIGLLVNRRIRTDDIIGRFSDDRFVVLLRRLDSSLGKLIATKIQKAAQERIAELEGVQDAPRVRVGLVGSGFRQRPLEELLVSAFDAVEQARSRDLALHCDLADQADSWTSPVPSGADGARADGVAVSREAAKP
jgi:diguanylate cyclase (GGDEF)-like protein